MTAEDKATTSFIHWYENLPLYSDFPAKGTIAGALVVLERLRGDFNLDIDKHTTKGGSQVIGAGRSAVKRILEAFGETRPFLREGGRTNRGLRGDIKAMLDHLSSAGLKRLPITRRDALLEQLQVFLVDRVREFHGLQRLEIIYDPSKSTWQVIHELLGKAAEGGKEGPVAQYLVGAKLQLRFPSKEISNDSYSTADAQLGRKGDFYVGDTVLHVTIAPMGTLYEKCKSNLDEGFKVYVIVPDRLLVGTKQNAELQARGRITVYSVESFVSQNIDELSGFSRDEVSTQFLHLLETYNKRVDVVEANKSMMIEIPVNLPSPSDD